MEGRAAMDRYQLSQETGASGQAAAGDFARRATGIDARDRLLGQVSRPAVVQEENIRIIGFDGGDDWPLSEPGDGAAAAEEPVARGIANDQKPVAFTVNDSDPATRLNRAGPGSDE